jgi:hypothetical protein
MGKSTRLLVPSSTVREKLFRPARQRSSWRAIGHQISKTELTIDAVKFDTEQLPPILNALTTENGGQKLILEVAVRTAEGRNIEPNIAKRLTATFG